MYRYQLTHITSFEYDGNVSESHNEVRLQPLDDDRQSCIAFRIVVQPAARVFTKKDFLENWVHTFNVGAPHRSLRIQTESIVRVVPQPLISQGGTTLRDISRQRPWLTDHFGEFLTPTHYVPHLADLHPLIDSAIERSDVTALGFVKSAANVIHSRFRYQKGVTDVSSSIQDALRQRAGVCQDFGHLLLAMARMQGLPGRYVSGYLVPLRAAEPVGGVDEVIGGQSTHAWVEIFVPELGWVPQDPTLGRPVGVQHVRVAYGRDYGDVPPVRGVYRGRAGQRLTVDVRVRPALDSEVLEAVQEAATQEHATYEPATHQHATHQKCSAAS